MINNERANKLISEAIADFKAETGVETDENEFKEYLKERNMLNPSVKFLDKVFVTKANVTKILKEFHNPIKRLAKLLNMTYAQLGEATGYTKGAIESAVIKGKISTPLARAIELYKENVMLKNELAEQKTAFDKVLNALKKQD
ncbi:MAG: hypothetical protein SPF98_05390 [Campylobacter sp.]|nr:hypothetical protein [Campylobacter sp.]